MASCGSQFEVGFSEILVLRVPKNSFPRKEIQEQLSGELCSDVVVWSDGFVREALIHHSARSLLDAELLCFGLACSAVRRSSLPR